ncbi:hypothetical protein LTR84_003156 [Exophiala bonariae]|uniref:NmrA-like domain-containing protein n=1 Tax=Exophiala bonariae TaxID=1690606 RepID=A0AAV9N814_9EURO|nr:hypothetical protein LTR84_003156 [Exophiala bonariae]
MVKVAIAGGSGQVAREVIDALIATKKHEITILSRTEATSKTFPPAGTKWQAVDYSDIPSLTAALQGTHTVLSFIQLLSDPEQTAQKNLVDAAVGAGVKRFAPSEYGSKGTVDMPWWHGKEIVRGYLRAINEEEDVLEYTLFQPGLFLDYTAFPHKTSKYLDPLQTVWDFKNRRAIIVEGYEEAVMTLTTVADLAAIVALAVGYEGRWPTNGGIRGNRVTVSQIVEIGGRVRGAPFAVEKVRLDDLEAGELKTSWNLEAVHHAVAQEDAAALLKMVSIGVLTSCTKGAWDVSDELSSLFPDYQSTSIEDFHRGLWEGKRS